MKEKIISPLPSPTFPLSKYLIFFLQANSEPLHRPHLNVHLIFSHFLSACRQKRDSLSPGNNGYVGTWKKNSEGLFPGETDGPDSILASSRATSKPKPKEPAATIECEPSKESRREK
eukprot:TRINITY_DN6613_c0_g1_i20.p1 TRINITY_DN6613_c0_g1~~TRINITY_DN6613_c0_g1_i20.p1  ORF type:complete len:117 (-),score=17.94 TRINITY_DN6613_c0_g1_i20:389-739(-)